MRNTRATNLRQIVHQLERKPVPPGESVPRVVNNKRWSGCVDRWTAVPICDTKTVEKVWLC